jgi:V-type H+-transporting ATPase subunit H
MSNCSYRYTKEEARAVLDIIVSKGKCTALGKLEAVCNLLKSVDFRDTAWGCSDAKKCVTSVTASDSAPTLYKYLFALWMLSYDKSIAATLHGCVPVIKDILATCRVEKVIRLGLVVIKSFLPYENLSEEIVECGILDVVQQLEFEKWRDQEIYDNILEVSKLVAVQVSALSNFERYEKEVNQGHLKWGHLHSNKFWGENINKFEQNGFGVIENLCKLLKDNDDEVTQAVACYDIGEFAVLHPLGKKKLKDFEAKGLLVKETVMKLMEKSENRDVKREALLCCQKIMLNKWQDAGN